VNDVRSKNAHPEQSCHSPETSLNLDPYTVQGDSQFSECISPGQAYVAGQTDHGNGQMGSSRVLGELLPQGCLLKESRRATGNPSSVEGQRMWL
jgi:hypothetical protein